MFGYTTSIAGYVHLNPSSGSVNGVHHYTASLGAAFCQPNWCWYGLVVIISAAMTGTNETAGTGCHPWKSLSCQCLKQSTSAVPYVAHPTFARYCPPPPPLCQFSKGHFVTIHKSLPACVGMMCLMLWSFVACACTSDCSTTVIWTFAFALIRVHQSSSGPVLTTNEIKYVILSRDWYDIPFLLHVCTVP